MDNKDFDSMVEELREYAELEGSEIGEICLLLYDIYRYSPYMSESFRKAVEKEVKNQLQNFKDHCKIVDKSEVVTETWKELEWDMG